MGKLVELKTKENTFNVENFITTVKDEQMRKDSLVILKLMQTISKEKPTMWGNSMIGFGKKVFKSPNTGREVEWFKIGFSPRKANLSLHLIVNFHTNAALLQKLGKHKTGVGCLYIKKLDDIDLNILEKLIQKAFKEK